MKKIIVGVLASIAIMMGFNTINAEEKEGSSFTIHFTPAMQERDPSSTEDTADTIIVRTLRLGETVTITGKVHGSVGSSFIVEYDESAFNVKDKTSSDRSLFQMRNTCGGDRSTRTLKLKPLRKGEFTIVCKGKWRGSVSNVERYLLQVK